MTKAHVAKQLTELFKDAPEGVSVMYELPSTKKVKVQPMSFQDEKALLSLKDPSRAANLVIERCTEDLDIDSLYLVDKLPLLFKIRSLSFGSEYKITAICQHCSTENDLAIDLDKIPLVFGTIKDTIEVDLPFIKRTAILITPTVAMEQYLENPEGVLDNLRYFLIKLGDVDDKVVLAEAIKRLSSADLHTIIKALNQKELGLNTEVRFQCNKCKKDNLIDLPLTQDFFTVS